VLDEPAYGAAPGQAAVLYEDNVVVGAGTIRIPDRAGTSEFVPAFELNGR
jgi:hypothetical protein